MFDEIRQQYFPCELIENVTAESVPDVSAYWSEVGPVMENIFPPYTALGACGHTVPEERQQSLKPLAKAFGQAHHERFIFRTSDRSPVGYGYGSMRDGQTFFMTSSGVLPQFQRRGIYSAFVRKLLQYLYAIGYERVVSNHHPNNRVVLIAKLKLGFNVTAVNLDERWGAQVELTYLFHEDRRRGYVRAFSLEERDMPVSHLP